jgi:hypothetical protein
MATGILRRLLLMAIVGLMILSLILTSLPGPGRG